jgi:tetratricopeptide (TPR) repeat protein
MRFKSALAASAAVLAVLLSGCTSTAPATIVDRTQSSFDGAVLSPAARSTAVLGADGQPVGVGAYPAPIDAVKAGDMAAFLTMTQELDTEDRNSNPFFNAFLALDRAAAGDTAGARMILDINDDGDAESSQSSLYAYLDSWLLALDGQPDEAIERHRTAAGDMPGLTGDLSLAAMLEALGRPEQALAVYEAMTPTNIEAPEHEFDPKALLYSHVKTVISRHALLLQRLGRIEEAKATYQRLADAEPEEVISYAAALDSLETGKNLNNKALNVRSAFTQSLADVSRAMQEQRIIRKIMMGGRPDGFDDQRSALDQVALLINPEDEGLRTSIADDFYENALYAAAAHVALSGPKPTASLEIAGGQALIMAGQEDAARSAIDRALALADTDNKLQTLYGALQLRTLLDDEAAATDLVEELLAIADNPAEQAAAHGLAAQIYSQFGNVGEAAENAAEARRLDDTHDRRLALADALGRAGKINEGLVILRTEQLARPNDPYTLNSLGYFLVIYTDKHEEGYRILARARALAERDPYIADSFGWALYQLGDLNGARRQIEASRRELAPHRHWEIENHLGDIYWHLDRKDEAREAWQFALDNRPPAIDRRKLEAKLADGLEGPPPEKRPLPDVSLTDGEVGRQDI